jgi:Tol biopolymer transport system component
VVSDFVDEFGNREFYLEDSKQRVVVDGTEGPEYDEIYAVRFSADANRVAYVAQRDFKQRVVVDGVEGPEYDGIKNDSLVLSPDGKRVAYVAIKSLGSLSIARSEQCLVVLDGTPGREYHKIGPPLFSPDSKRLAYVARNKYSETCCVVIDGNEHRSLYFAIGPPLFSPDSKRLAYSGKMGRGSSRRSWRAVVDGTPGHRLFDAIGQGLFSPDSAWPMWPRQAPICAWSSTAP